MQIISVDEFRDLNFEPDSFDVVFFGSGISIWEPSSLPSGERFAASLFQLIFGEMKTLSNEQTEFLETIFRELPFEVVNESCPNRSRLKTLLSDLYSKREPNDLHRTLAKHFLLGNIKSLVTPNYDLSIEAALDDLLLTLKVFERPERVVDSAGIPGKQSRYFKLHGSADQPNSLVFALNQEAQLPDWKAGLLSDLIRGKKVLIIGYSGKDFDICPQIQFATPSEIIWNFWAKEHISLNAHELAAHIPTTFVIGDMREIASSIYDPVSLVPSAKQVNVQSLLEQSFNKQERWLWGIRALNTMNFSGAVLGELRSRFESSKPATEFDADLLGQFGSALASSGKYVQAGKAHEQAADILFKSGLDEAAFSHLLGASDAFRCAGKYWSAIRHHLRISRDVDPQHKLFPHLVRNEILLLEHAFKIFKVMRIHSISRRIQKRAAELIAKNVAHFREIGDWYSLQQMALWASKFCLPGTQTAYKQGVEVPEAYRGYRQLNFLMGTMMAFRHNLVRKVLPASQESASQARFYIEMAKSLGLNTEVWKLYFAFLRRLKAFRQPGDFTAFIRAFLKCEYTIFYRLVQLVAEN